MVTQLDFRPRNDSASQDHQERYHAPSQNAPQRPSLSSVRSSAADPANLQIGSSRVGDRATPTSYLGEGTERSRATANAQTANYDTILHLKRELRVAQDQARDNEVQRQQLQFELDETRQSLANFETEVGLCYSEIERLKQELCEARAEIQEGDKKRAVLNSELDEARQIMLDGIDRETEVEGLKHQLHAKQMQADEAENDNQVLRDANEELSLEFRQAQRGYEEHAEELQMKLGRVQCENARLIEQQKELRRKVTIGDRQQRIFGGSSKEPQAESSRHNGDSFKRSVADASNKLQVVCDINAFKTDIRRFALAKGKHVTINRKEAEQLLQTYLGDDFAASAVDKNLLTAALQRRTIEVINTTIYDQDGELPDTPEMTIRYHTQKLREALEDCVYEWTPNSAVSRALPFKIQQQVFAYVGDHCYKKDDQPIVAQAVKNVLKDMVQYRSIRVGGDAIVEKIVKRYLSLFCFRLDSVNVQWIPAGTPVDTERMEITDISDDRAVRLYDVDDKDLVVVLCAFPVIEDEDSGAIYSKAQVVAGCTR